MKLAIFLALFALAFAASDGVPPLPNYQLHIPEKCEDVLAVKVCDRLNRTATALKLKSEEVKKAVLDAYKQGKQTAQEIEKSVKDFLMNKVYNKKCEDLTSVDNCNKLRKLAADLKVQADKVEEFIVKQIAELKTKTCEDLMSADHCTKLRDLAGKIKIRAEKLQEMLVAAYINARNSGKDQVVETYNKVKDYIMSTKCEDMFNPDLCTSFRKYAEKTKVALPRIMEIAVEFVKKGVAVGKSLVTKVYDVVDYFYDCTDIFDDSSCDRIKRWAAKLKVTAEEVEKAIKKYVRVFIEKGTTIYKTIKDFVKEKVICRFKSTCSNSEDEMVVVNKRSILGDWKNKVREILNNKFPNLEASVRAHVEKLIDSSRSLWAFMRNVAKDIKNKATAGVETLKKLMVAIAL